MAKTDNTIKQKIKNLFPVKERAMPKNYSGKRSKKSKPKPKIRKRK